VVFAVGLEVGVTLFGVAEGTESDVPGTKQPVWQLAALALQVIMQLVAAEDCASRIFASATTPAPTALIAAEATRIARTVTTASVAYRRERRR
jgi:hypothetical protein